MYINLLKYFEDVFQWQLVALHVAHCMQNILACANQQLPACR